jgi:ketosteroid isomerase-like protein
MSESNVELHRRAIEAFNARDIEALIAYFDPSIEFHSTFAAVGGAVYHGHDGMRKYFRDQEDAWGGEILHVEPQAYFDIGGDTLAFFVMHGRGRRSGAEVAMPIAQVARWRDGLIVNLKAYAHREDALRDLGVSEDELESIAP